MSEMREDGLSRRLRAANPVPSGREELPSGRSVEQLVEATMAIATEDTPTKQRARWRVLAAAAVVAAAGTAGGVYLATGGGSAHHAKSVIALKLPTPRPAHPGLGGSCIVYNVDLLARQQQAFSGTVDSVGAHGVALTVDHWYKGGRADQVDLRTPGYPNAVNEFGVKFEAGHRYLVSATGGTVTGCGYTAAYSAQLASDFTKAFG